MSCGAPAIPTSGPRGWASISLRRTRSGLAASPAISRAEDKFSAGYSLSPTRTYKRARILISQNPRLPRRSRRPHQRPKQRPQTQHRGQSSPPPTSPSTDAARLGLHPNPPPRHRQHRPAGKKHVPGHLHPRRQHQTAAPPAATPLALSLRRPLGSTTVHHLSFTSGTGRGPHHRRSRIINHAPNNTFHHHTPVRQARDTAHGPPGWVPQSLWSATPPAAHAQARGPRNSENTKSPARISAAIHRRAHMNHVVGPARQRHPRMGISILHQPRTVESARALSHPTHTAHPTSISANCTARNAVPLPCPSWPSIESRNPLPGSPPPPPRSAATDQ